MKRLHGTQLSAVDVARAFQIPPSLISPPRSRLQALWWRLWWDRKFNRAELRRLGGDANGDASVRKP